MLAEAADVRVFPVFVLTALRVIGVEFEHQPVCTATGWIWPAASAAKVRGNRSATMHA
jgi:hypothetical protein